jgi:CheY-like chemotaxis protein
MDVQMPRMGGLDATAAIRQREEQEGLRRMRIVAMTAHAMVGDREKCLTAGMDGYLTKPIDPQRLYAVVEEGTEGDEVRPGSEPIDRAGLLARTAGDEALAQTIIGIFLEDCPNRLAAIRAAIEAGDGEALRQAAHALKGAAANLSASRVFEASRTLERLGAEKKMAAAEAAWRVLSAEASLLLDSLRAERAAVA